MNKKIIETMVDEQIDYLIDEDLDDIAHLLGYDEDGTVSIIVPTNPNIKCVTAHNPRGFSCIYQNKYMDKAIEIYLNSNNIKASIVAPMKSSFD